MAVQKSPHTQSQENTHFAQTDVNPDELEQTVGTGEDAAPTKTAMERKLAGRVLPSTRPIPARPTMWNLPQPRTKARWPAV